MSILRSIVSGFILLAFSIVIGVSIRAQQQTNRNNTRQEVTGQLLARLESPEMLMIERRGTTMTIAASLAPQSTFEADGRERHEQLSNRRWTKVTVTLRGEQLVVSSNGYKENDFNVTFDASESDNGLRVRRQIYSDKLTQPVVVDSVYERTADVAQWNVGKDSRPVLGKTSATRRISRRLRQFVQGGPLAVRTD